MAFRRNIEKPAEGQIRKKAVILTGAIFSIFLLASLIWTIKNKPAAHVIEVQMLSADVYLVEGDTTNYDNFASILKMAVGKANKTYSSNRITLKLPPAKQSKEIADVLLVVNAMDVDWDIIKNTTNHD